MVTIVEHGPLVNFERDCSYSSFRTKKWKQKAIQSLAGCYINSWLRIRGCSRY